MVTDKCVGTNTHCPEASSNFSDFDKHSNSFIPLFFTECRRLIYTKTMK